MSKLDFIMNRKSIRKYKPDPVPHADILQIIQAATYAPSGSNAQNWHFVVLKNPIKIKAMAEAVEAENQLFCTYTANNALREKFKGSLYYQTLFKDAPVVILLYAAPYHLTTEILLREKQAPEEVISQLTWHSPGIQNIGAAMENLLLAATAMGYGTCWMTAPVYAESAINKAIDFHKDGYKLVCLTPLGVPLSSDNPQPKRKPLEEVMTVID